MTDLQRLSRFPSRGSRRPSRGSKSGWSGSAPRSSPSLPAAPTKWSAPSGGPSGESSDFRRGSPGRRSVVCALPWSRSPSRSSCSRGWSAGSRRCSASDRCSDGPETPSPPRVPGGRRHSLPSPPSADALCSPGCSGDSERSSTRATAAGSRKKSECP